MRKVVKDTQHRVKRFRTLLYSPNWEVIRRDSRWFPQSKISPCDWFWLTVSQ
jgi:hypothetical protein